MVTNSSRLLITEPHRVTRGSFPTVPNTKYQAIFLVLHGIQYTAIKYITKTTTDGNFKCNNDKKRGLHD
jgi:hypothetical protein